MKQHSRLQIVRALLNLMVENPAASERELSTKLASMGLPLSRSSVNNYRNSLIQLGVPPEQLLELGDEELKQRFGRRGPQMGDFIEPDWPAIQHYLDEARVWSKKLPTLAQAYKFKYVAVNWPAYVSGPLPPQCMSERTFERRYGAYLEAEGITVLRHDANPSLNFGPASVMEIDTIGDRLTFIDAQGISHATVVFTAVLKYSGLIYAEAMMSNSGLCWAAAILNACAAFGGCCQALRSDNDPAICLHGKAARGGSRLRPVIAFLLKELEMVSDLCPIRSPRWKAINERSNLTLEQHLFEEQAGQTIHAADLTELNRKIRQEVLRINSLPRAHGQLSRLMVFETYERSRLKPLPLLLPQIHNLALTAVRQDGYVRYLKNFYYVGLCHAGNRLVVENCANKRLRFLNEHDYREYAVYPLDPNQLPPGNRHKLERFCNEDERRRARDREWFLSDCATWPGPHDAVVAAVELVWKRLSRTPAVAARMCNFLWSLHQRSPEQLAALNEACRLAVDSGHIHNFRHFVRQAYEIVSRQLAPTEPSAKPAESTPTAGHPVQQQLIRGGDYYAALCH